MKNRAILSCWLLLLGTACGNTSSDSPSTTAGGSPSGGTAGTSMSGAGGGAVVMNGGTAGVSAIGGGAGLAGAAGSSHGGATGGGGGSAGIGGSGGSGTSGGSAGNGGSGGVQGVPGVPSGPVVLCFGTGCPLGTCDHNMILSQTSCPSVYTSDLGPSSMLCNAGETATYCLQVTDDFGDRFAISCANGTATSFRCNTGCLIAYDGANEGPATCQ